jgi:hypothetical protein
MERDPLQDAMNRRCQPIPLWEAAAAVISAYNKTSTSKWSDETQEAIDGLEVALREHLRASMSRKSETAIIKVRGAKP